MRVLVCGGRDFYDFQRLDDVLTEHAKGATAIIHGCASGADQLADEWATDNDIPSLKFPADWGYWGRFAGPKRNQQMIDEGKPDLVIAFPGRRGTADMVRRAKAAGIKVIEL